MQSVLHFITKVFSGVKWGQSSVRAPCLHEAHFVYRAFHAGTGLGLSVPVKGIYTTTIHGRPT